MKLYGIYEQVVGIPASSLSQLRGPWTQNVEDPCFKFLTHRFTLLILVLVLLILFSVFYVQLLFPVPDMTQR